MRVAAVVVLAAAARCLCIPSHDTVLFVVTMSEDSASLFYCDRNIPVREMLAGPAMMGNERLMLHSAKGYVLYELDGTVIDSHSLAGQKPTGDEDDGALRFCCPLDTTMALCCRPTPSDEEHAFELRYKRMDRKRLRDIDSDEYATYEKLTGGVLVNIARNAITDEMARRVYLHSQLVGFSGLEPEDQRWWSLDRFYSFSSPLVHERDSLLVSFFPGIGQGDRQFRDKALDAIGTFERQGRRYYVGVSAPMGGHVWRSWQTVYFCDAAGNVLYTDSLLKQTNTEVTLGFDKDPEKNVVYTARATKKFVFPPVVRPDGSLIYGSIDYDTKELTVHRRVYPRYVPSPCEPRLAHLIDLEKDISYEPVSISCGRTLRTGAMIPRVRFTDAEGNRRTATVRDLACDDFLARIARESYRDLESKLVRGARGLPSTVAALCDSLGEMGTAACPYVISLSGPKGVRQTFNYGAGEDVLCARVIAVRANGHVVVRVDLEEYAEILIFTRSGGYHSRFIFSRQPCTQRNDVVVARDDSPIVELDYEADPVRGTFQAWGPSWSR
jgi:hypothetical protein